MISFRLEVVGINVERQTDLFDFNYALVLFRFFFTLCLFETVFAVIDDFAYGGVACGAIFTRSRFFSAARFKASRPT